MRIDIPMSEILSLRGPLRKAFFDTAGKVPAVTHPPGLNFRVTFKKHAEYIVDEEKAELEKLVQTAFTNNKSRFGGANHAVVIKAPHTNKDESLRPWFTVQGWLDELWRASVHIYADGTVAPPRERK